MINFFRTFFMLVLVTAIIGVAGLGVHQLLYKKPGVYLWSITENGSGGYRLFLTKNAGDGEADLADSPEQTDGGTDTALPPQKEKKSKGEKAIKLFNGKDLGKWESVEFGGEGEVFVNEFGEIEVDFGAIMTGIKLSEAPPATSNYELSLDAKRLSGNDFFCAVTFPVQESHATLVIGGWGGGIVGISSVDDLDASENETMSIEGFADDQWYAVRIRVTDDNLSAWIDDRQMVDLDLKDRKISLRPGDIELCKPLGIASFITRAAYRNIEWKPL